MSKTFRFNPLLARVLCCGALAPGLSSLLVAQSQRSAPPARILINRPIDAARVFPLAGNTRGEANAHNDRGSVANTFAMEHMLLQLRRSPERELALRAFIDQQHDSTSPNFHKWLTPAQFGEMFGPSQPDIDRVTDWLRLNGFTVNTVYPSGMVIDFSGTAGQVAAAFHTEIHHLSVDGAGHIANMSDPRIPEALAPVVGGVVSLHDFRPLSMKMPAPKYRAEYDIVVPEDLATIYDLKPAFAAGYDGAGQTIAVVETSDLYDTADWDKFRKAFGLSSYTSGSLATVNPAPPHGVSNCSDPGANFAGDEATLDAEWASAAAPNAAIQVASCADQTTTPGFTIATLNTINASHPPKIMSVSYGYCEAAAGATANAAYNSAYQQAVAEGISVFVAAGDEGAAGCDQGFSAATHGIGVSATSLNGLQRRRWWNRFRRLIPAHQEHLLGPTTNSDTYGSALSYIPEIPWNDSCANSTLANLFWLRSWLRFRGLLRKQQRHRNSDNVVAGSGGPSGCATGVPAAESGREWDLQGIPETLLANGRSRDSERWRPGSSRRLPLRRQRPVGPLLCVLLFRYPPWWRAVRRLAVELGRRRRNFILCPDHGRHSGAW